MNNLEENLIIYTELEPLIRQAGTGVLYLEPSSKVIYLVSEPIYDVTCSIIGSRDNKAAESLIVANFDASGSEISPYLINYDSCSEITIKRVKVDLNKRGRGGLFFKFSKRVTIEACSFTGYDPEIGHYRTDSSVLFASCQDVVIHDNVFFKNGGSTNNDEELNRCITIHDDNPNEPISNSYTITKNTFKEVNQGVVIQSRALEKCVISRNVFNQVVDNALYLLNVKAAEISHNHFSDSADEGIVISGWKTHKNTTTEFYGKFQVVNNYARNVAVKFLAINGDMAELYFIGNTVISHLGSAKERPAAIAWRRDREHSKVKVFIAERNTFNLDTAPANFDVFPFGDVGMLAFRDNKIILQELQKYQKLFSLNGMGNKKDGADYVEFTNNRIRHRLCGKRFDPESQFLRESYPLLPIRYLIINQADFPGRMPLVYPYLNWTPLVGQIF
ncbi:hypothetical protein MFLO_04665 [Listeria floridensis FSL S10-1187]|uniref:Periplasmic copper-binding protein NosD beta helix domain-containing protein n=1 Tax=Listeria floridensis FSL S10-1187 TaxID=1265817 RepID=A0ABP3AZX8_9LIST|nr:hypothetical protein MFLO_04665 [Listeria floridensis FSL S10-1187]